MNLPSETQNEMSTRMSEEDDFQSNRPYTLFYYPSSRLPPRTMFEDEACRFWCLFDRQELPYSDGEEERDLPFSVNSGLKWDVDQLTNAIRQQKRVFYDFDTSDIVLLKVRHLLTVQCRCSCSNAFTAEGSHSSRP